MAREAPLYDPGADAVDDTSTSDDDLIAELAALGRLDYAKRRKGAAKQLGIGLTDLDKIVAEARGEGEEPTPALYEHWNVDRWNESVDGGALLEAIVGTLRRYVAMSDEQAIVVALWIMLTWLHDEAAIHSPILLATSPQPNSGKTTLLKVVSFLVRRGLSSVSITGPALFRSIEKWQPTFIIDEADTAFVGNGDLKEVVNSGWTRGDSIIRCDPDTHEPRPYATFCPKAIGMIGRKLPPATLSRCLIIAMQRKQPDEHTDDFDYTDSDVFAALRSQIARWAADYAEALGKATPETPPGFHNRTRANWRLLLAIAEQAGGGWKVAAHKAALEIEQVAAAADPEIGVQLLSDMRGIFDRLGTDKVTTKTMLAELAADAEGPWLAFGRAGKPIGDRQVVRLLKDFRRGYGIRSRSIRADGIAGTAKGYSRADFEDDFAAYLSPVSGQGASLSGTTAQTNLFNGLEQNLSGTSTPHVPDKNGPNPLENNTCAVVPDKKPVFAETDETDDDERRCAQCGGGIDGTEREYLIEGDRVWLHDQCKRFYLAERGETP